MSARRATLVPLVPIVAAGTGSSHAGPAALPALAGGALQARARAERRGELRVRGDPGGERAV